MTMSQKLGLILFKLSPRRIFALTAYAGTSVIDIRNARVSVARAQDR